MGDEMVFTRVVFLLLLEKVNTCEDSILSLAIYGLVYLRGNWFYLGPKLLLNPIQVKPILVGDQIDSQTKVTKSSRPTDPVEICFRALGEIKIDNNINSLNIYPPCEKICTNKVPACPVTEIMENSVTVVLQHFCMDVEARVTKLRDLFR